MARRRRKRNPDPTEGLLLAAALGSLAGAGTAAVTTSSLSEKQPGKRIVAGVLLGTVVASVVVAGTMIWVVASR